MDWEQEKMNLAEELTHRLYDGQYIQTMWNAREEDKRAKGWTLKSGIWSPWFLNLRPIGDEPKLVADISYGLARMLEEEIPDTTRIVGVEMAGIPIAAATSMVALERMGKEIPFAYTRPLPKKVRTPEEAAELLAKVKAGEYGQKSFVEGTLEQGDVIAIWDDMVTNMGSKLIARQLVYHEVEARGLDPDTIRCNYVAVTLDREQGALEAAAEHDPPIKLCRIIPFGNALDWLQDRMDPDEHALVSDYVAESSKGTDRYLKPKAVEYAIKHKAVPPEGLGE